MENNSVSKMFAAPAASIEKAASQLAKFLVREDAEVKKLEEALQERKNHLEQCKIQLAQLLQQAGLESIKLKGGLTPRAKIVRKYYKQTDITEEQLFQWLSDHDLSGIIRPAVNFQTLQSTLIEFESQGNSIPSHVFNVIDTPTVILHGKTTYLQKLLDESTAA
jgi:hypothetical protein